MSYRRSSSNPVRLHLTVADAEALHSILTAVSNPGGTAERLADRLAARIEEATAEPRQRSS